MLMVLKTVFLGLYWMVLQSLKVPKQNLCSKSTTYCVCGKIFFNKKIQTNTIRQKKAAIVNKIAAFAVFCVFYI